MLDEDKPEEILSYEEARDRLEHFKQANPDVISELSQLTQLYNERLEAAEKFVRSNNLSVGDFNRYQLQETIDGEALFEAVGLEIFLRLGGVIETKTSYKVDPAKFRQELPLLTMLPGQSLPLDKIVKRTPRYHMPKKLVIG